MHDVYPSKDVVNMRVIFTIIYGNWMQGDYMLMNFFKGTELVKAFSIKRLH